MNINSKSIYIIRYICYIRFPTQVKTSFRCMILFCYLYGFHFKLTTCQCEKAPFERNEYLLQIVPFALCLVFKN